MLFIKTPNMSQTFKHTKKKAYKIFQQSQALRGMKLQTKMGSILI